MKKIKAVLFDMDGLLVDSERLGIYVSVQAGREMGFPVTEELAREMLGITSAPEPRKVSGRVSQYGHGRLSSAVHAAHGERCRARRGKGHAGRAGAARVFTRTPDALRRCIFHG